MWLADCVNMKVDLWICDFGGYRCLLFIAGSTTKICNCKQNTKDYRLVVNIASLYCVWKNLNTLLLAPRHGNIDGTLAPQVITYKHATCKGSNYISQSIFKERSAQSCLTDEWPVTYGLDCECRIDSEVPLLTWSWSRTKLPHWAPNPLFGGCNPRSLGRAAVVV